MAKKKQVVQPVDQISGRAILADNMLAATVSDLEGKMGKAGCLIGSESLVHVLPVPALSARYLLMNEGLPLGRVFQIIGPQASYKSTMAAEFLRWHRMCGGGGVRCEAETKDNEEMRNSVLNWDAAACRNEECNSLEDWMRKTTWFTVGLQKRCEAANGPGRTIPFCFITDTLTGKASEKTVEKIRTEGAAGLNFPIEANKINTYLKAYPQLITGWPFTFIGVNHLKIQKDPSTGIINYNIPGGWALKFQCAMIFDMERIGAIKEFSNYRAATVAMRTYKNSYGPDNIQIMVRFKTWNVEDAPGIMRLHSRFEWWEASILLLATGLGMRKAQAELLLPRIKEVCDLHQKSGGSAGTLWWSKRLGVTNDNAMSAHELGMELERHADVLSELYNVLGIARRPFFRPGVDYLQQLDEYAHVAAQADQADDIVRRAKSIQSEALASMGNIIDESGVEVDADLLPEDISGMSELN